MHKANGNMYINQVISQFINLAEIAERVERKITSETHEKMFIPMLQWKRRRFEAFRYSFNNG